MHKSHHRRGEDKDRGGGGQKDWIHGRSVRKVLRQEASDKGVHQKGARRRSAVSGGKRKARFERYRKYPDADLGLCLL